MQPTADRESRLNRPVPTILVGESHVADEQELLAAVIGFVLAMLKQGFHEDQLPVGAMHAYHINFYVNSVENGGHKGLISNNGWNSAWLEQIASALSAIGDEECQTILSELITFNRECPKKFVEEMVNYANLVSTPDPFIDSLDNRFFRKIDWLRHSAAAALKILPDLEVVPDSLLAERLGALQPDPEVQKERQAEAWRAFVANHRDDPIFQASARIAASTARDGLQVLKLTSIRYHQDELEDPDDWQNEISISISVETTLGNGEVVFEPEIAWLCLYETAVPCAGVKMDALESQIWEATGKSLRDALRVDIIQPDKL